MPKTLDLTGQMYGKLLVIRRLGKIVNKVMYECKCECGNIKSISHSDLRSNRTKSCGCYKKQLLIEKNTTHGLSVKNGKPIRLFRIWSNIKTRTMNPKSPQYIDYGGRGIKLDRTWLNFEIFYKWSMTNGYEENLSIDRINVNGDYTPNNCRWADVKTQANNRRNNINITLGHSTKTLTQWCDTFNLNYRTVQDRIKRNWSIETALLTPVSKVVMSCHN